MASLIFALTPDLRLKHPASIRSVPMHKTLIDLGFLAFVRSCMDRLFPALKPHASGRLSDSFGKHFARFLRSVGIDGDKVNFHSFRHNFSAASDACGAEFSARERIMGHALAGQAARYGDRYAKEQDDMRLLEVRNGQLQKLPYPVLDLADVFRSARCK
jgi:integrase